MIDYKVGHYYKRIYDFGRYYDDEAYLNNTIIFRVTSIKDDDEIRVEVVYDSNVHIIPYYNTLCMDFDYSKTVEVSESKVLAKIL